MSDACARAYAVSLTAPDISRYRDGNTGVDYVHRFESGVPGPEAMINAVIHGNELCGAIALDQLLRGGLKPTRGALTVCFVNPAAYHRFDPGNPTRSRFVDEDMNRVWTTERLDGPDRSVEKLIARAFGRSTTEPKGCSIFTPWARFPDPILLIHGLEKERRFAARLVSGHGGLRSGTCRRPAADEYAPFNDPDCDRIAVLVECGQHWAKGTEVAAVDTALHFLMAST